MPAQAAIHTAPQHSLAHPAACPCSVQYGGSYETSKFAHNTADGLTMMGVGMSVAMVRRQAVAAAVAAAA